MTNVRILMTLCCVFVLSIGVVSADPSLIAHWTFDEGSGSTAVDNTGNGNDATLINGPAYVAGVVGSALEFDGTNDYAAIQSYAVTEPNQLPEMTVCAWFKTNFTSSSYSHNWALLDFDRSESFNFYVRPNDGKLGFSTKAPTGGIRDMTGNAFVNDGQWHYGCAVYSGNATSDKQLYVDGVLDHAIDQHTFGEGLGDGTDRYGYIGDGSESATFNSRRNNRYYEGAVDELRFYSRALSAAEIQALYLADLNPDNTSPSVPTNLGAFNVTQNAVTVAWSASNDPESGVDFYRVYRGGTVVGTPATSFFEDTGLTPDTAYSYTVSAVNGAGLESGQTPPLLVTTLADTQGPYIVNANATSTFAYVVWSEPIPESAATNLSKYSIPGLAVTSAFLLTDYKTVFLTTTDASEYTVSVTDMPDLVGNVASDSFTYNILGCFP